MTQEILDLVVSPVDPTVLVSCSEDKSIRIYSLDLKNAEQPLMVLLAGLAHADQISKMVCGSDV